MNTPEPYGKADLVGICGKIECESCNKMRKGLNLAYWDDSDEHFPQYKRVSLCIKCINHCLKYCNKKITIEKIKKKD